MGILYSTGPVENAAANAGISALVKILNNSANEVNVQLKLFSLNGLKQEVDSTALVVAASSSDYYPFEVTNIIEYEIQIATDSENDVLFSVWGLDADGNFIAAQRFVHKELSQIVSQEVNLTTPKKKILTTKKSRRRATGTS
ncbi:MAG: hypothetical protein PHT79_01500 [Syntrophomonadaceae bacterium]|nr:hypothetical protein [Syntrophomonadaceae bacterium]MDD3890054.1 hypothetical protein [Syntrophomonadaceae bacterium]MDD4548427.1 hypothetical protein [Syntrophomonadaceae bacterium]